MLNLYKNYIKKNIVSFQLKPDYIKKNNNKPTIKNFPPSTREWDNSIYTFNKNYLSLIPEVKKISIKLIKSYFNLYNIILEKKIKGFSMQKRFKKLSSNKIYVSNGIFKHTNNKVIITIYVYNRQKINYTYIMKQNFLAYINKEIIPSLLLLKNNIQIYKDQIEKNRSIVFEKIKNENNELLYNKYQSLYIKIYDKNLSKKLFKIVIKKYKKYFLYKQLIYINKCKFNYNYLSYLSTLLKKVYNKNIQFDIINLKYFYLNSDIFTESILLKIRRNRRQLINRLNQLIFISKIKKISKILKYKPMKKNKIKGNYLDPISELILRNTCKNKQNLKNTVISLTKYKIVTGVRLKAKGRLTKRYTASRSMSKLRYKGNLINLDSSSLGLSSVILKGNLRSNLQYTKLNSKTRIGSFGLKGWVSGY